MAEKVKKTIEDLLQEAGLINDEVIRKAEEVQKVSGDSIKNILVRMGAVAEEDVARAEGQLLGIPFFELSEIHIDISVIKMLPQSIAIRNKVIPVLCDERTKKLTVAMVDPMNVFAIDEIRLISGYDVEAVIATEDDIIKAITQYYGIKMSIDTALGDDDLGKVIAEADVTSLFTDEGVSLAELKKMAEEAPIVRLVNVIIMRAIRDKSSDIHIEPQKRELKVRFRVDGIMQEVMTPPKGIQPLLISRLKIMANMDIAERRIPQDGRIQLVVEGKEYDFRVSTYPTIFGEKVVLRILDKSGTMIGLEKLGFPSETRALFEDLIDNPYGMLLVTGPTGSGKTTTLYSALSKLNVIDRNILTIEDPIEYQLDGVNQIQVNEKAGLTFSLGLRHLLRQDPDVIMVGEIRDRETAAIAVQSSLTGHLVLSTLHTNDAPSATTRLIDMGIEPFLVASSISGVLAQRLVRVICPSCRDEYQASSSLLKQFGADISDKIVTLYRGRGCDKCRGSGYKGRLGVFELMYIDDHIRDIVVKKQSAVVIKKAACEAGMRTLQEDCVDKILHGITTVEEGVRVIFVEE